MRVFSRPSGGRAPAASFHGAERRQRARRPVRWPVALLPDGAPAIETVTQNLSSAGFYCLSPARLTPGQTIACTLRVPTHDPSSQEPYMPVACRAHVVRVEMNFEGAFGIACRISDYHLLGAGAAH